MFAAATLDITLSTWSHRIQIFDSLWDESHENRTKSHSSRVQKEYFAKILLASIKDNKVMPNKTETVEIQEFAKNISLMHLFQREELSLNYKRKVSSVPLIDVILHTMPRKHPPNWNLRSEMAQFIFFLTEYQSPSCPLKCWTPVYLVDSCLQTVLGRHGERCEV